jgi:WD40-like Beta Propeller Repeat
VTEIEDVVRRSLAEQVYRQPPMTDAADRAVAGANAVRRRQTALAVGAVVVVLSAMVSGGVALRGRGTGPTLAPSVTPSASAVPSPSPTPSPSATPSLPAIGMSALVQGQTYLLAPDGRTLSLSGLEGQPGRTYQIAGGWLVNTNLNFSGTDGSQLWLLRPDGSVLRLLDHLDGYGAVSPDGRSLAWRSGGNLVVGHFDGTGTVVPDATTPAPERGDPLLYTGSAVLIGYSATGGGIDNFDVWVPQQGRYTPSWDRAQAAGVTAVFGATADRRWLIGLALAAPGSGGKDTCVARIDPLNKLRVVARACGLPEPREWGEVSPDGHWLAYQSLDANGRSQTTLVDLTTVFQQPKVAGTWPMEWPSVWTGPDTMMVQGLDQRFYRYRVGQPAGEEVRVLGAPPAGRVIFVPKLS